MEAIDPRTETVFLLSEARHHGIRKSYRSLHRYVTEGVPVMNAIGRRVVIRLARIDLPTGMATSLEAYHRFVEALTSAQKRT